MYSFCNGLLKGNKQFIKFNGNCFVISKNGDNDYSYINTKTPHDIFRGRKEDIFSLIMNQ